MQVIDITAIRHSAQKQFRHTGQFKLFRDMTAALGELRAAWLLTTADQALYRTYANGAVTKSLRGQLVRADWCDLSECHLERFSASIVYEPNLSSTQRLKLYGSLIASE